MKISYRPVGVCSQFMEFDISDDGIINDVAIYGGCNGNLQGIMRLIKGMSVDEAVSKLRGIKCGFRPTSCPDQIATALSQYSKA